MSKHPLHPELVALCDSLDALANTVFTGHPNDRTMQEQWGWNFPAVNRHGLSRVPSELAEEIRQRGPDTLDEPCLAVIKDCRASIERLTPTTTQYLWNGHGKDAVPAYMATLSCVRASIEPLIGWQSIDDTSLFPAKMARKLRSFEAELKQITPDKEGLKAQIALITEATSAAESLPTDLQALADARKKIGQLQEESILSQGRISERLTESESGSKKIKELQEEASKLVGQCEEAYRITTTKGLAAAFTQQAKALSQSMWVWVVGLIVALATGYFMGSSRLEALAKSLNATDSHGGIVWINAILALLSFGAPVWLAWLATKQIGQRFKLGQDYGYKASIAKAYEGYRREAARIDPELEARLFDSALTRLEEHPLRLVEEKTPGSPWHEFVESNSFREALKKVPGFRDQFDRARNRSSSNGSRSLDIDEAAEPPTP